MSAQSRESSLMVKREEGRKFTCKCIKTVYANS